MIARPGVGYVELGVALTIAGVGTSLCFATVANAVVASVPLEEVGVASGTNNALRELGGVFGVAVLAAVFTHRGVYGSPHSFVNGFQPAIWVAAGLSTAGITVLAVDVGGSHVKALVSGGTERRRFPSGAHLTAAAMVGQLLELTKDWAYDVVSVGVPAQVLANRVVHEPVNLGGGWVGFDFEQAFGKPTKAVNDAAMQALGSYEGGRMLL